VLRLIEAFLMPPLFALLVIAAAFLVRRRRPRAGGLALFLGFALLVAGSLPVVGSALLRSLQTSPPLDLDHLPSGPRAIVVLSADMTVHAPEYGGQTVGPMTMQRLRYAARLRAATDLPLLVSGGMLAHHEEPHAVSMRRVLERELDAPVRWIEDRSTTTAENARFTAELLRREGITSVFLVTHAWHMPRARACFAAHGIETVAAPTAFAHAPRDWFAGWLPRWTAQRDVALALHEWLGRAHLTLFGA